IMGEVDLLLVLVPFEEREIDDPAKLETVAIDQVQLFADLGARLAGKLVEFRRLAGDEEAGVALIEAELGADRFGALRTDVLRKRAGASEHRTFLAPEDVTEARLPHRLRPGVHAVAEGA